VPQEGKGTPGDDDGDARPQEFHEANMQWTKSCSACVHETKSLHHHQTPYCKCNDTTNDIRKCFLVQIQSQLDYTVVGTSRRKLLFSSCGSGLFASVSLCTLEGIPRSLSRKWTSFLSPLRHPLRRRCRRWTAPRSESPRSTWTSRSG